MNVYGIGDLHLAKSIYKPMDVFGEKWANYMERIEENWINTIKDDDIVIIPGDISWATYLDEAFQDFLFLEKLPGTKIIFKGNHDYWWTTNKKMEAFCIENSFKTINILQNKSYIKEDIAICGTRGWPQSDCEEDIKIFNRELNRLELSLSTITNMEDRYIIVALHYPPFNDEMQPNKFTEILEKYSVNMCIFGHLHHLTSDNDSFFKKNIKDAGRNNKIEYKLVSADFLEFNPLRLR